MIHIKQSQDGLYYFIIVSKNGRTLATSQMYKRKENAMNGVTSLVDILQCMDEDIEMVDDTK